MTDRELVKSILNQCKNINYDHKLETYINEGFIKFNDKSKCTHLDLGGEELTEIPGELLELKHLKFLSLCDNQLTYIPDELNYIKDLHIEGNPIFKSKDKVEILFNKNLNKERT